MESILFNIEILLIVLCLPGLSLFPYEWMAHQTAVITPFLNKAGTEVWKQIVFHLQTQSYIVVQCLSIIITNTISVRVMYVSVLVHSMGRRHY